MKAPDILYVGIDLGTLRSAVAASNGQRHWVYSFVGWPKDFVARKVLGKSIVFGEEAINNRLSVDLVRPLASGVIREGTQRDQEAVRQLVLHLFEHVQPAKGQEIRAAVGVPAEALKVNKEATILAVGECADRTVVVSEPFAVAYKLGALNNACIIDIGAGTIDFCVMHGVTPEDEDQRTLLSAGDYVDRQLYDLLREAHPNARFSETMVRQLKEQHGRVGNVKGRVKVKVPVAAKFVQHDLTREVTQACESLVSPIADTLIDLIKRYEPSFQQLVRKNIFLAGGGSQIKGIAEGLTEALADHGTFRVQAVEDPLFIGADGALELAMDMPSERWENL